MTIRLRILENEDELIRKREVGAEGGIGLNCNLLIQMLFFVIIRDSSDILSHKAFPTNKGNC